MKLMLVLAGLLVAGSAFAQPGGDNDSPFALSARIESTWNKLEWPENDGDKQYDNDFMVSALPSFELRQDIYLVGRFSYPIRTKLPEFAVGVEFALYGQK